MDCARLLALELSKESYDQISTRSLLAQAKHFYLRNYFDTHTLRSVDYTAHRFFGIVEVVAGSIEMECYEIDKIDFFGLSTACMGCSEWTWKSGENTTLAERC